MNYFLIFCKIFSAVKNQESVINCRWTIARFLILSSFIITSGFANATNYTWTGTTSTAWNTSTNWSPNGIPGAIDSVTIVTASHLPVLDFNRAVIDFTMTSGTLNLNTYTLTVTGVSTFNGGTINNGTINPTGTSSTYAGTTFGAKVVANNSDIYLNGSIFNSKATFFKSGSSGNICTGGNIFNDSTSLTTSGAYLQLGYSQPDTFNTVILKVTSTATGDITLAYAGSGNQFNGDIYFNVEAGTVRGILFGSGGGTSTLASGKKILVGNDGVNTGYVYLSGLNQLGSTPQNLVFSGDAVLHLYSHNTFNGKVNFSSPGINLGGTTFNDSTTLIKTGSSNELGTGGDIFNGHTILKNEGTGSFLLSYYSYNPPDTFNLNLTLINTNSGYISLAIGAVGTAFNGNLYINNTGTGYISTGMSGGTATLASGKTISVGGLGFSDGALYLYNFTQLGTTAQTISGTGTSTLGFSGCTFNGRITTSTGGVAFETSTFNKKGTFTQTGDFNSWSTGGNKFNDTTSFTITGAGYLLLGQYQPDTLNSDVTFTIANTATNNIHTAYTGANYFNGNVYINLNGSGGVTFGNGTGTSTLVSGKKILVGGEGANSGYAYLRAFTQTGSTSQALNFTGAGLLMDRGTTFNGKVNFTATDLYLNNVIFNDSTILSKTGSAISYCPGGNLFNGVTTLNNAGTGYLIFGQSVADTFSTNLTINNSSSADIRLAENSVGNKFSGNIKCNIDDVGGIIFGWAGGTSILASGKTISEGSTGISSGSLLLENFTQLGSTPQTINTSGTAEFYIYYSTFNGSLGFTGPYISFYQSDLNGIVNVVAANWFTRNSTYDSTVYFTKNDGFPDAEYGGNIFNGDVTFSLSGSSYVIMGYSNNDIFNGDVTCINNSTTGGRIFLADQSTSIDPTQFNGNIYLNSIGDGGILFGANGGYSNLASGKTINVDSVFNAGYLGLNHFTQVGSTPQNLEFTGSAGLYVEPGTIFNGKVDFKSPGMYLDGATYNDTATFTQTGSVYNSLGAGSNTYNSSVEIINEGTGYFLPAYYNPDTFNGDATFTKSSSGILYISYIVDDKFYRNITTNGDITFGAAGGTVKLEGGYSQLLSGTTPAYFPKLSINKSANHLTLDTSATAHEVTFTKGNIITTADHLFKMDDGATFTGASDSSFVDGPMLKTGDDAFIYPLGKDSIYQPVAISAPSATGDEFTAEFFHAAPPAFTSPDNTLSGVSDCEYWTVDRNSGSSDISVTLIWNPSSCTLIGPPVLKVAQYDTAWHNVGANGLVNSGANGSITSDLLTDLGIFTFGSDLCGSYRTYEAPLHLIAPSDFFAYDSLTTNDSLSWSIDHVPTLTGFTDDKHTVIVQIAEWEPDPVTGAYPYWGNSTEFATVYIPGVNPLTTGTYQKLIDDLIDQNDMDKNYFWRVGIQYLLPVGAIQPVTWSETYTLTLRGKEKEIPAAYLTSSHTNDINWVYEVTYLDENKTNQVISYIDGLGKSRQSQVLMNSTSTVMCSEVVYSEEAGGTVQSMVAPTGSSTFGYAHRFFDVKTGSNYSDFKTAHFDREVVGSVYNEVMSPYKVDTTAGVGNYYRNNSTYEEFVDDAKGYPYAYSVSYKDPINRPMLVGGVGETFKITGGKEIKSFSTAASYLELKRIYGKNKADSLSNISKSIVMDPNGVGSVTYTDAEGQVIATALTTCSTESSNLDELNEDGKAGFTAKYNILSNDQLNAGNLAKTSSSNFFLSCPSSSVSLHYQIDQGVFGTGLSTCKNCKYEINMKVVEDATGLEVFNKTKKLPTDTTQLACDATPTTFEFDTTMSLSRAGTYTVYRTIGPQVNTSGRTVVDQAIYDYTQLLHTNIDSLKNQFKDEYYAREEWYALRNVKSRDGRPMEYRKCVSTYLGELGSFHTLKDGYIDTATVDDWAFRIDIDKNDNIYFLEATKIRKISPSGIVTTILDGDTLSLSFIDMAADDSGNVYFSTNAASNVIKKLSPNGVITDIYTGKTAMKNLVIRNGYIYFSYRSDYSPGDSINFSKITITGTMVKENILPRGSEIRYVAAESNYLYSNMDVLVNEEKDIELAYFSVGPRIWEISIDGTARLVAGGDYGCVNGVGAAAKLGNGGGIVMDKFGTIYKAEHTDIRKIDPITGLVTNFAGTCGSYGWGNGPIDSTTYMYSAQDLDFDSRGNIYFVDYSTIRKISVCDSMSPICPEILPTAQMEFSNVLPVKLTLRPNSIDGKDSYVTSTGSSANYGTNKLLIARYLPSPARTTNSILQFDMSSIPAGATILDARLSLYWDKTGLAQSGDNEAWIKRVTSSWTESSVNWSTKPSVTSTNAATLPASTHWWQNYENVDVTALVSDIYSNTNYGMEISLKNTTNGTLSFASSDNPNALLRPKLDITYAFSGCDLDTASDYATVTLSIIPPADTSASTVDIGQAVWENGMTKEQFVSALVASVNSNYGSNNKGFTAHNKKGGNAFGEFINTILVTAQPGTGKSYNGWKLSASISYESGIDSTCFKISTSPQGVNENAGLGSSYVFKGGFNSGQCEELLWYPDLITIVDTTISSSAKKILTDLDGLKSDPHEKERYVIDGLSSPSTSTAAVKEEFIRSYQRAHWVTIPESDIISMQTYPVSGSTNLTIPRLLENRYLDNVNADYTIIRVKYRGPSCEDRCVAREFPKNCSQNCEDRLSAIDADIFTAYDTITKHTFGAYTAPDNKNYLDLSNTTRTLKYLVDKYYPWSQDLMAKVDSINPDALNLYLAFEMASTARSAFDMDACMRNCNDGPNSDDICQTCKVTYNGCVYGNQAELAKGYEYFMKRWDEEGHYPYSDTSDLRTAIAGTSPVEYKPVTDEFDGLGQLLYTYIVNNFASDTVRAHWDALGGSCSNCAAPADTNYNCSAGVAADLSYFPSKLFSILEDANASCVTEYHDCLLKANDFDLSLCQTNREQCFQNAENGTDSTLCSSMFNCDVSLVGTDSLLRMRLIYETVKNLYINPDTILSKSNALYIQTESMKMKDLVLYLPDYEREERCRLQCAEYLDAAFTQWLQNKIDSASIFITNSYTSQCYNRNEKMEVSYQEKLYHYTLYDYNSAGQLLSTVPPEGVDYVDVDDSDPSHANRTPVHRMRTLYVSNSLDQLKNSYTPDGDVTKYLYDKAGRVRFSQTKEQELRGTATSNLIFSYTKYDIETGRILEVGEYSAAPDTSGQGFINPTPGVGDVYASDKVDDLSWPTDGSKTTDESNFYYDQSYLSLSGYTQQNLDQRVSRVSNANANTYYSYDKHGRVNFVVQELLGMASDSVQFKTVDYRYLPITSQVQQVIYQKGKAAEEFRHRYTYDSDNRLTKVEVSRDTVTWEKAAAYDYYLHGPLKSNGLGDSIQKLDYVYNLQGWLKAINHPIAANDPGQDDIGEAYTKDVFGMVLHYYSGDYNRTGKNFDVTASITPQSGSHIKDKGKDLYNGNISAWTSYTGYDQTSASSIDPLMGQGFRYDKLNRLVSTFAETQETSGFSGWTANSTTLPNIFQENLKYDANGNIDTLIRTCGNVTTAMDNMYYRYTSTTTDYYGKTKKTNNKLGYIDDNTDVAGVEDITDQSSGNYVYDAKGRLVKDFANEIDSIIWTPYDKVKEVIRTSSSTKARLQFTYDAMGRRVSKKVIRSTTDSTLNTVTYYSYDASGNLMGTYVKEYTDQTEYKYTLTEEYIYGSSRVGSFNNGNVIFDSDDESPDVEGDLDKASLRFEITDHLGNVRAVVTGELKVSGAADIVMLRDYYAFGMEMPGRKFTASGGEYRYGFNGMEKTDEVYGDGDEYTTEFRQYDPRVGRWFSPDPLASMFADESPYNFVFNNPINQIDPKGLGPIKGSGQGGQGGLDQTPLELPEVLVTSDARGWFGRQWGKLRAFGQDSWGGVKNWTSNAWSDTKEWAGNAWEGTKDFAAYAWNDLKSIGNNATTVVEGFVDRVFENNSPPGALSLKQRTSGSTTLYNSGNLAADVATLFQGGAEVVLGVMGEIFGGAISTTGVGATVGVPTMAVSTTAITHGGIVFSNSVDHICDDINDFFHDGNNGNDPEPPNTTKNEREVHDSKLERDLDQLDGIEKAQHKHKKNAKGKGKQHKINSTKKSEQKVNKRLKDIDNLDDVEY